MNSLTPILSYTEYLNVPSIPSQHTSHSPSDSSHISSNYNHTCAIKTNSSLVCWGHDSHSQSTPPPALNHHVQNVSAGYLHTCAIRNVPHLLVCWGSDAKGQTDVPEGCKSDYVDVAAGLAHTCAVTSDLRLMCWGYERDGRTNVPQGYSYVARDNRWLNNESRNRNKDEDRDTIDHNEAGSRYIDNEICNKRVSDDKSDSYLKSNLNNIDQIQTVQVGLAHTCYLNLDGSIKCFGWNLYGQTDVPDFNYIINTDDLNNLNDKSNKITTINKNKPYPLPQHFGIHVPGYPEDVYYLEEVDNLLDSIQEFNQIGNQISSNNNWRMVSSGALHSCGIQFPNELMCWGYNKYKQSELPNMLDRSVSYVDAGYANTCVVYQSAEGKLEEEGFECMGNVRFGQNENKGIFWNDKLLNGKSIAAGLRHTCVIYDTIINRHQYMYINCVGNNSYGQLNAPKYNQ